MRQSWIGLGSILTTAVLCAGFAQENENARRPRVQLSSAFEAADSGTPKAHATVGHPGFLSPHASPVVVSGGFVFVANTPADTVDVIDAAQQKVVARVNVGVSPVGLAVRPDGKELWVANHISDSISVIDLEKSSPTFLQVIATVQDLDPATRSTRFDEPVGIAFANNQKAYVSLSSENQIAVINVATREITNRLPIKSQDPRAIRVQGNRLYVLPFESHNKTQLSGGAGPIDGDLVTFDAYKHSITNNNVLSLGAVVDVIKHPDVPDRDLYIFDTDTDELVKTVDTLGTLLYGLSVDSQGNAYIAQTDARNDVNGRAGTKKHGLAELENRPFLNRITRVGLDSENQAATRFFDLEPQPPGQPAPGMALATPYAIEVSADDSTLVATAAGSNTLFTLDSATGKTLGRTDVGAEPEGIALENAATGKPARAWVLNAGANTVSLVDLSDLSSPRVLNTITLDDPTHPGVKRGRIAFHAAKASSTGTFSCASCHPDGNTDQLLWVLNTPIVTGGNQIMPRSSMPIRGLRDTAPFHWDGIPGDPYGGNNSANVHGSVAPNSDVSIPESSTRHLVDGGLASTMSVVGDKAVNDEGKAGRLSAAERDDMATFLLSVPFPPAQRRAYTNVLSTEAAKGFKLFHVQGDLDPGKAQPNVCGDCHRMPYLVSTNTPGTGMDTPTWRGAYDRWLILPQGRMNMIDFPFYKQIAEEGTPEQSLWQLSWGGRSRFNPVWDMVLEGSTGFPGAYARQLTLNSSTAGATLTTDLFNALERSSLEGATILQAEGVFIENGTPQRVSLQFDGTSKGGVYVQKDGTREAFTRDALTQLASQGRFVGTFTARIGTHVDVDHPQPALWTLGPIEQQRGHQQFPVLTGNQTQLVMSGRHIEEGAHVLVDGIRAGAALLCEGETVQIELAALPAVGTHFLQVQNPDGLVSNDFIFHVVEDATSAADPALPRLSALLTQNHFDRIIGTWVDEKTQGQAYKTTFAWKVQNRIIELTRKDPTNESISLIGVNASTEEVFHMGSDRHGTQFSGKWDLSTDNSAIFDLTFLRGTSPRSGTKILYHLIDDNTLEVGSPSQTTGALRLIRSR